MVPRICGGGQGVKRLREPPLGGYRGEGASEHPPLYAVDTPGTVLRWEGRVRCGRRVYHVGRFITREVRREEVVRRGCRGAQRAQVALLDWWLS